MSRSPEGAKFLRVLVYAALSMSIVSSLGMPLVPTVSEEMNVSISTAQWTVTINLLVGAASTPIMGRLSDGPHTKRLLIGALALVLLGSCIAALASNFGLFLIGRALQGLTYGIVPMTIALARRHLEGTQQKHGISSLSVTVSTGIGIGYPLTGVITSVLDYRFAFWFAALFVLSAIGVVVRGVPSGTDLSARSRRFDYVGATLLTLGLTGLLLGVSEGPVWGWTSPALIGVIALAALLLVGWVAVELRSISPLIDIRVSRHGDVLLAHVTAIGLGTAMYMGFSIASLIAQAPTSSGFGAGLSVFWAGFVFLPFSVGSFTANRLVRAASARLDTATFLPLGALVVTTSTVFLWAFHDQLWQILIGMLLFGAGMGGTYAAMPTLIASSVATAELGSTVSFNQVLRTVGGSIGSAIVGAVLAMNLAPDLEPTSGGIDLALLIAAGGCGAVLVLLLGNRLVRRHRGEQPPPLAV